MTNNTEKLWRLQWFNYSPSTKSYHLSDAQYYPKDAGPDRWQVRFEPVKNSKRYFGIKVLVQELVLPTGWVTLHEHESPKTWQETEECREMKRVQAEAEARLNDSLTSAGL